MHRTFVWLMLALLMPLPASADDGSSVGVEMDLVSRYVFRGFAYSDGPALQPSAWVATDGLRFGIWSDLVLSPGRNQGRFDEIDLFLECDFDLWGFTLTPGLELYSFFYQEEEPITGELLFRLSRPIGPVEVFTAHAFDIGASPGAWFGEVGMGWEWSPLPFLSVEAEASVGFGSRKFNAAYVGLPKWAANVASLCAAVSFRAMGPLILKPHGGVSVLLDPSLRSAVDSPTLGFGGVSIGLESVR